MTFDPEVTFRCLHYRAHELTAELVRAAEGKPGEFQRDYHTTLAIKKLEEIASALGFVVAMRVADEPEDYIASPEDFALEGADHALMRRLEDDIVLGPK
jgi:hypothetical protein